jgi:ABC-type multidrug transport system fused ATPase/permease subunit
LYSQLQESQFGNFAQIRQLFSKSDQIRILLVTTIQIALSILDLISVAFVGLLTALSINGIQSKQPTGSVVRVINLLGLEELSFQQQAAILGLIAGILLVVRTVLSLFFQKKLLKFLSLRAAGLSSDIVSKLTKQSILVVQEKSVQETIYLLTVGIGSVTFGVIATAVTFISDLALLLVMLIGLMVVDPIVASASAIGFGLIGFGLFQVLKFRASKLATDIADWSILSNQKISEVLISYREATVQNRREYYSEIIGGYRYKMAHAQADSMFIPTLSKYIIEMTMVMGAFVLAATQFLIYDAFHAISILAIFLAAGSRVAPAILRLQQGAISIKSNLAVASNTLKLWERINLNPIKLPEIEISSTDAGPEFSARIILDKVSFRYPNSSVDTIRNFSLEINPGEMVALAGSSGAGKSTLADLILGVLEPTSGRVLLSGTSPSSATGLFPGKISYVPQDVLIVDGTIRTNVALGYPDHEITDDAIWSALKASQLDEFVSQLEGGIHHLIGERGTNLSGGQRQRLGLARGLFTQPQLLVLDEATSALDSQTEAGITEMLVGLKGSITLIVIAHRLSTIKDASRVIYIRDGELAAEGSYEDVEREVSEFGS